jgi:glycine cleavage system H lipoate-binding protein
VNEDCYGKGWMVVISMGDGAKAAIDSLLDEKGYAELLKTAAH